MFCSNCGAKIDEHVKFCPKCGAAQHADASGAGTGGQQGSAFQDAGSSRPGTWQVEGQPAQEPKISIRTASMLCYWFSFIGWLICYYFSDNRNPYLKFHLNQALVLWLCGLLGMLPQSIRPRKSVENVYQ